MTVLPSSRHTVCTCYLLVNHARACLRMAAEGGCAEQASMQTWSHQTHQHDFHALPGGGVFCGVLELANLGGGQYPAAREMTGRAPARGRLEGLGVMHQSAGGSNSALYSRKQVFYPHLRVVAAGGIRKLQIALYAGRQLVDRLGQRSGGRPIASGAVAAGGGGGLSCLHTKLRQQPPLQAVERAV